MPQAKRSLGLIYAVNPFGADHQSSEHDPMVEDGAAVILSSSELPELLHLSSRCYVMSRGRIVAEVAGDGLTEAAILSHYFGH